ncbi:MAG: caspase family protein [Actinobacteria bacterium]|nr:MAG: caspase family protein [Actinomycetota bacterium]
MLTGIGPNRRVSSSRTRHFDRFRAHAPPGTLATKGGKMRRPVRSIAISLPLALIATLASTAPARAALSSWIIGKYPLQAAAAQTSAASTHKWALLIGINDYASPTVDNIGARQDAEGLRTTLVNLGWRTDHVILIRDRDATAQHIIDGIRWLSYKTKSNSIVVFHYSGHENHTRTLADGDNETMDVELWAADNHYILDGTLGREMNRVAAYHMWIDISTCRAAGFSDYGMVKAGRILTFSSPQSELSYEDPYSHHSVFTWWEVNLGIYGKRADANHDGKVTVEEAFWWSRPYVSAYTRGLQQPYVIDRVSGSMYLN